MKDLGTHEMAAWHPACCVEPVRSGGARRHAARSPRSHLPSRTRTRHSRATIEAARHTVQACVHGWESMGRLLRPGMCAKIPHIELRIEHRAPRLLLARCDADAWPCLDFQALGRRRGHDDPCVDGGSAMYGIRIVCRALQESTRPNRHPGYGGVSGAPQERWRWFSGKALFQHPPFLRRSVVLVFAPLTGLLSGASQLKHPFTAPTLKPTSNRRPLRGYMSELFRSHHLKIKKTFIASPHSRPHRTPTRRSACASYWGCWR